MPIHPCSATRTLLLLASGVTVLLPAAASACTQDDFARAVDAAGASLRDYNRATGPQLQARLRQLKERKGWSDAEYEGQALEKIGDAATATFDAQGNELLDRIDQLGRPPDGRAPDCANLDQIQASSVELLAVMKAKMAHTMAKIDAEIGAPPPSAQGAAAALASADPAPPPPAELRPPASAVQPASPAARGAAGMERPPPQPPQSEPSLPEPARRAPQTAPAPWTTTTAAAPPATAAPPAGPANPVPGRQAALERPPASPTAAPDPSPASDIPARAEDSYTIDEVREATSGFFGGISTSLAGVVEHAFSTLGRPSGYVLGEEGGGAFLAGARYGSGTLYLRRGMTEQVYWHGPSVGYDFGASGSRTMFLIYGLKEPEALYRSYTGIDGSAYLIGGFGVTILKGGDITMAPIRSGLGLRVGASLGYVSFTRQPGWNPF